MRSSRGCRGAEFMNCATAEVERLFFPVGVAWGEGGRCEREEDIGGTKVTQTITQAIAKQLSQVNCAEIVSVNSVEGGSLKTAF